MGNRVPGLRWRGVQREILDWRWHRGCRSRVKDILGEEGPSGYFGEETGPPGNRQGGDAGLGAGFVPPSPTCRATLEVTVGADGPVVGVTRLGGVTSGRSCLVVWPSPRPESDGETGHGGV